MYVTTPFGMKLPGVIAHQACSETITSAHLVSIVCIKIVSGKISNPMSNDTTGSMLMTSHALNLGEHALEEQTIHGLSAPNHLLGQKNWVTCSPLPFQRKALAERIDGS
eukprot:4250724-Amphidinium_carterae.1